MVWSVMKVSSFGGFASADLASAAFASVAGFVSLFGSCAATRVAWPHNNSPTAQIPRILFIRAPIASFAAPIIAEEFYAAVEQQVKLPNKWSLVARWVHEGQSNIVTIGVCVTNGVGV